jgi:dihydrofolate synthase / folylpolyglutamate synthase
MEFEQQYREALAWIHGIGRFGMKPGLERINTLLERLGNPHHRLKFLHIGGTNGKGSTAAFAASILQAAGCRVALYTSPYLLSFTNRMALNGRDISPAELVELVKQVRPLVEQISADPQLGQMTEFEVVTTLALAFFARRQPDLVVFEVGLGGRLDATNVVTPLAGIITNVSLEHTDVLGDTVQAIAREKAGIIKPGVPLITATADADVLAVLEERCRELAAPLYRVLPPDEADRICDNTAAYSRERITGDGQYLSYRGFERTLTDLFIPLRGGYQAANAATALAAVELLSRQGFEVDEASLRRGLAETRWPGRLEVLSREPLLIMDGAHNPAAVELLAGAIPEYFRYRRLILVLGVMADKDIQAIMGSITPLADEVVLTRPSLPRAAEPKHLAEYIREIPCFTGRVHVEDDLGRALELALSLASPADAVLVTGSLYTVSDARAYWETMAPA